MFGKRFGTEPVAPFLINCRKFLVCQPKIAGVLGLKAAPE